MPSWHLHGTANANYKRNEVTMNTSKVSSHAVLTSADAVLRQGLKKSEAKTRYRGGRRRRRREEFRLLLTARQLVPE